MPKPKKSVTRVYPDGHVEPPPSISRTALWVDYGVGSPSPNNSPDHDAKVARELREAAGRLLAGAAEYEASAGYKRVLRKFGMGPDTWERS